MISRRADYFRSRLVATGTADKIRGFIAWFFFATLLGLFASPRDCSAEIFQYRDDKGKQHFVDSEEKIPEEFRKSNRKAVSLPKISRSKPGRKKLYEKTHYENSSSSAQRVEVFVADWCGYCKALEKMLQKKSISYQRRDIEKDGKALKDYKSLGGGGIPITRIGKKVFRGYAPESILTALGKK
jgi:glutaredoxin